MSRNLRDSMPNVAAFVDAMRDAFGADEVNIVGVRCPRAEPLSGLFGVELAYNGAQPECGARSEHVV
jgi:hypothetical protein